MINISCPTRAGLAYVCGGKPLTNWSNEGREPRNQSKQTNPALRSLSLSLILCVSQISLSPPLKEDFLFLTQGASEESESTRRTR